MLKPKHHVSQFQLRVPAIASHLRKLCLWTIMSLASRFQKVRADQKAEEEILDLSRVTYDELQNRVVRFGKAKIGQPFHQVVHEDPGWVQWFVGHYASSTKPSHMEFIKFTEMYVEKMEANQGTPPVQTKKDNKKAEPKSKSKTAKPQGSTSIVTPPMTDDSEDEWDPVMSSVNAQIENHALQNRMNQMEGVLQQVVMSLQQIQLQIGGQSPPPQ